MTEVTPIRPEKEHEWILVGYWHLTEDQILAAASGSPINLKEPDSLDGPGCLNCEVSFASGKDMPCLAP